jgi:outer membrane protein OmpA-like peptidoglycan-associated protein
LGKNDAADPDVHSHPGDTPGSLGVNDHAALAIGSGSAHKIKSQPRHHGPPVSAIATRKPGKEILERLKKFRDVEQGASKAHLVTPDGTPLQIEDREGLVAQIYFATDESSLDKSDKRELLKIYNYYAALLFKQGLRRETPKVHIKFVGYADIRGSEGHNVGLSERRANAVAGYFEGFRASNRYTQGIVAMGSSERPQEVVTGHGSVSRQLNPFRRVDVIARPVLTKVPEPKPVVFHDPVSKDWALRLRGNLGYSKTVEKLFKKLPGETLKQIVKHIPELGLGYNVMLVEIVDLTNRVAMIYTFEGISLSVGWDLNFGTDSSEWCYVSTTSPIHVQDFEGHARHTGGAAQPGYGYAFDYIQFFGPMGHGADSVYLKWGGWGKGRAMSMDTEIRGSLSKRVDPYPVPADYLD